MRVPRVGLQVNGYQQTSGYEDSTERGHLLSDTSLDIPELEVNPLLMKIYPPFQHERRGLGSGLVTHPSPSPEGETC